MHSETLPLRGMFEKLFNLPNSISETIAFMESLNGENSYKNIIQRKLWKRKLQSLEQNEGVLYLPINMFVDDFDPFNTLGSYGRAYK